MKVFAIVIAAIASVSAVAIPDPEAAKETKKATCIPKSATIFKPSEGSLWNQTTISQPGAGHGLKLPMSSLTSATKLACVEECTLLGADCTSAYWSSPGTACYLNIYGSTWKYAAPPKEKTWVEFTRINGTLC